MGHLDRDISHWARTETPLFGSNTIAESASSYLYAAELTVGLGTLALTPGGDEPPEWLLSKARGLLVEGSAVLATSGITESLKQLAGRERPNGHSGGSFPSGHSSGAFSIATLGSRNLDSIDIPESARWGARVSNYVLAGSVAWARVEAGEHYPVDVLAGASIGHFLSAFIHDAFLGLEERDRWWVSVVPDGMGATVELGWSF